MSSARIRASERSRPLPRWPAAPASSDRQRLTPAPRVARARGGRELFVIARQDGPAVSARASPRDCRLGHRHRTRRRPARGAVGERGAVRAASSNPAAASAGSGSGPDLARAVGRAAPRGVPPSRAPRRSRRRRRPHRRSRIRRRRRLASRRARHGGGDVLLGLVGVRDDRNDVIHAHHHGRPVTERATRGHGPRLNRDTIARPRRRRPGREEKCIDGSHADPAHRAHGPRDGALRTATWDEALDRAAAGAAPRHGAEPGLGRRDVQLLEGHERDELRRAGKFARQVLRTNNIDSCNRT